MLIPMSPVETVVQNSSWDRPIRGGKFENPKTVGSEKHGHFQAAASLPGLRFSSLRLETENPHHDSRARSGKPLALYLGLILLTPRDIVGRAQTLKGVGLASNKAQDCVNGPSYMPSPRRVFVGLAAREPTLI